MGAKHVLPLLVRVDIVVKAMKGFSTFLQTSSTGNSPSDGLVSYLRHSSGVLLLGRDAVSES